MHSRADATPKAEGELEVNESGIRGLDEAFWPELVWVREHLWVVHDATITCMWTSIKEDKESRYPLTQDLRIQ